jgi:enediyne biosynthesis protein E4
MAGDRNRGLNLHSRRNFLKTVGRAGAGSLLARTVPLLGQTTAKSSPSGLPAFEEIPAAASGITWSHVAGISPMMYMPETMGAGCAFIDYDNDGWMDIYLVNSGPCDFYTPPKPLRNALYHNNRDGTFTDVTETARVPGNSYGMGAAVGDYDADGFPDLYVTQYGHSILYHNNGDGTFTDVTEEAGVKTSGWGTAAVWFDYDNDGRLDLFVGQFAPFDKSIWCGNKLTGERWYCKPSVYQPMPSRLFHNNGDGTFTEVSKETGIDKYAGKPWAAVAADINNDGWMDLFVSNDTVANFLLLNDGKGKFKDIAPLAGVGYNAFGLARSGMGVDACDYDQDGLIDLIVTNVDREMTALYHNDGNEVFTDIALTNGIARATIMLSTMAVAFVDYDNDGNSDILFCNGHPEPNVAVMVPGITYKERMLLFRNTGKTFENVSLESGPIFSKPISGRGLAMGDFNNDGSVDALISISDDLPILLRNNAGRKNHWLGVRLIGKKCNIDAVGAKLTYRSGDLQRHRTKVGGGSYFAYREPRLVLGLGQRKKIDWLEVKWPQPSGATERLTDLPIDRYITIVEGEGKWK